jgi:hypothetical protein
MKLTLPIAALIMVMALPAWADGSEEFDPDQPFREAVTQNLLQSWLHHALDLLEDHLEITGTLAPPDGANGDRSSHLRLKVYPEGKSKSGDSITAEGWLHRSPDGRHQELFFRFTLPESSPKNDPAQFEHVL